MPNATIFGDRFGHEVTVGEYVVYNQPRTWLTSIARIERIAMVPTWFTDPDHGEMIERPAPVLTVLTIQDEFGTPHVARATLKATDRVLAYPAALVPTWFKTLFDAA